VAVGPGKEGFCRGSISWVCWVNLRSGELQAPDGSTDDEEVGFQRKVLAT
jgi:hypothetical protein